MIFNVYIFREGEVKIIHLHRLCIDSLFSRISNMAAFVVLDESESHSVIWQLQYIVDNGARAVRPKENHRYSSVPQCKNIARNGLSFHTFRKVMSQLAGLQRGFT